MRGPKISSIDALHELRLDVKRFEDDAARALEQASAQIAQAVDWIRLDRAPFWKHEIARRKELVTRAKSAMASAKLTSFDQAGKSYVDERKRLEAATRSLAEAEDKLAATRRWARRLEKEHELLRGRVQTLATFLAADVPRAADRLRRMGAELDQYVSMEAPRDDGAPGARDAGAGHGMIARRAAGADGAERTDWRRRAPGREARRTAPLADPIETDAGPELLDRGAAAAASRLGLPSEPPPLDDRVVLGPGWPDAPRLLLVRAARPALGDTGWYLGDAAPAAPPEAGVLRAVRLGQLVREHPELETLLSLPRGWAAIVASGGVEAVYDDHARPMHLEADG